MPDLETFGRTLLPQAATHRAMTKLHALFAGLDAQAAFPERLAKLDAVVRWVRDTARVPALPDSDPGDRPQIGRVRLLVAALEQFPECARALGGLLGSVLGDLQAVPLLARAGLPADRGLLGETMDRLSRGFLPEPVDERDLAQLSAGWFGSKRDLAWLGSVPPPLVVRLARALCSPEVGNPWAPLSHGAADALALIAQRVAGVGLNDAIRVRSPQVPVRSSPFFLLPRANDAVLAGLASGDATHFEEAVADCRGLVRACLETVGAVRLCTGAPGRNGSPWAASTTRALLTMRTAMASFGQACTQAGASPTARRSLQRSHFRTMPREALYCGTS
jgi:site-specific recombinase